MATARFFCAAEARARDESIFGTAARVDTWLLLETPGAWSAQALPVERLPISVQRHFETIAKRLPRSRRLLIRQRHARHETLSFFVVESAGLRRRWQISLREYEDLLSVDPGDILRHAKRAEDMASIPKYLVCTHGRHDKCCAKFGFATYCALRDQAGDSVWQCSHVGGDRFAANVVLLPQGIYYGNVFPEEAAELVELSRGGKISLKHYRGRSSYGRAAQIGEYLTRKETGLMGLDNLQLLESLQIEDGCWRVQFAGTRGVHEVEFRARENAFTELLTCGARQPAPVTQYELSRYRYLES